MEVEACLWIQGLGCLSQAFIVFPPILSEALASLRVARHLACRPTAFRIRRPRMDEDELRDGATTLISMNNHREMTVSMNASAIRGSQLRWGDDIKAVSSEGKRHLELQLGSSAASTPPRSGS